jgi:hypothetical protein
VVWTILKWIIQAVGLISLVYFSFEMLLRRVFKRTPFKSQPGDIPIMDESLYGDYSEDAKQRALKYYADVSPTCFQSPEDYMSYQKAYYNLSSSEDPVDAMNDLLDAIDRIPGS